MILYVVYIGHGHHHHSISNARGDSNTDGETENFGRKSPPDKVRLGQTRAGCRTLDTQCIPLPVKGPAQQCRDSQALTVTFDKIFQKVLENKYGWAKLKFLEFPLTLSIYHEQGLFRHFSRKVKQVGTCPKI